jgi:hypothetical protein
MQSTPATGRSPRKGLSKKTRFDVFKRDGFVCQYCGAHPPAVVLNVDHVTAVANGGGNDPDNLTTSCEPCNSGKGARPLSAVPQSLSAQAAMVAEKEAQLRGYHAVMEARKVRLCEEMWRVAEALVPGSSGQAGTGMDREWLRSIKTFNERLGVHVVLEAVEIARAKPRISSDYGRFKYFCGVCWKMARGREATS